MWRTWPRANLHPRRTRTLSRLFFFGRQQMALVQVDALGRLSLLSLTEPLMAAVTAAGSRDADEGAVEAGEQEVRRYLEAAPAAVLQELLAAVLSRPELAARLRYRALRLLLRGDVAALALGMFPREYHGRLVGCLRHLGAGLHSLDLKGTWLRDDDLTAFCDALADLGALRVLGVPRAATDELLEAVGRHCPRLHALDVSGETRVTRRGLQALCASASSLQVSQ